MRRSSGNPIGGWFVCLLSLISSFDGRVSETNDPERSSDINTVLPKSTLENEYNKCGNRNIDGIGFDDRSLTDWDAKYGEFPWLVAILLEKTDPTGETQRNYICGGSLIQPDVILTAAFCVLNRNATSISVRAGEWDFQSTLEPYPHQDRQVKHITIHEDYNQTSQANCLALLFLDSPFELEPNIQTICLPAQGTVFSDQKCTASGWGKHKVSPVVGISAIPKKLELPVVDNEACQTALRTTKLGSSFALHDTFLCAGGQPDVDTCLGDGGAPLACPMPDQPDRFVQAGIVAWGVGCGMEGLPGVYTSVSVFTDWINRKIEGQNGVL
ncbi:phenoloxidase-activating factor 2-like isoform X2 [Uranotaenia lowii]|uniref:phenoloxidase-activating factor 2-like isoform X2 n=1 Tax=Uranotaenia lowii TaxID=190385 RepID=UPI00247B2485|nr:phenoloxidase-activating factor 2-like isoform X2 [Uranotaenia lowii]